VGGKAKEGREEVKGGEGGKQKSGEREGKEMGRERKVRMVPNF